MQKLNGAIIWHQMKENGQLDEFFMHLPIDQGKEKSCEYLIILKHFQEQTPSFISLCSICLSSL